MIKMHQNLLLTLATQRFEVIRDVTSELLWFIRPQRSVFLVVGKFRAFNFELVLRAGTIHEFYAFFNLVFFDAFEPRFGSIRFASR